MNNEFPSNNEISKSKLLEYPESIEEAEMIQDFWRGIYAIRNFPDIKDEEIRYIAGCDVTYDKNSDNSALGCAVVWDRGKKSVVEVKYHQEVIKFEYIPGLLAFRESSCIKNVLNKLSIKPDLLILDGHGLCHPKRFGEAIHIGFALDISSFGVAKNPFWGSCDFKTLTRKKGNKIEIKEGNEILGFALIVSDNCRPVFVSTGYRTNIDFIISLCLELSGGHKQPEPVYLADYLARERLYRKK